ncbi:peptidase M28-like protein [Flavobacterium sp. 270]|uniref:M28 family metallopeptidase n=1 Tax=Flavobacterium sp. 270 TaxID=2512114 RepID=UPI0010646D19|nr:M28 family metallopeptidase [Flavobacterium sp. 270]TDW52713.1 peptidase M28-like protein [Flavobacterium sp. 270]
MKLHKIKIEDSLLSFSNELEYIYRFDELYVFITSREIDFIKSNIRIIESITATKTIYFVIQKGGSFENEQPDIVPLMNFGRYLFVELDSEEYEQIIQHKHVCWEIEELSKYKEVFFRVHKDISRRKVLPHTFSVSKERLKEHLDNLCKEQSRFAFSKQYLNAVDYCKNYLKDLGYDVNLQEFKVLNKGEYKSTVNVIATKSGVSNQPKTFIVGAHLDSINKDGYDLLAPGADDNASGSAGVLEMAEQLIHIEYPNNLIFILFGAEELGLYGSKHYVSNTMPKETILGIINMDMIARKNGDNYGVLVEGHEVSKELVKALSQIASDYTNLKVDVSYTPYASDHVPFINANYPALLTIEGSDSSNIDIHTDRDVLTNIDYELMSEILKANLICVNEFLSAD